MSVLLQCYICNSKILPLFSFFSFPSGFCFFVFVALWSYRYIFSSLVFSFPSSSMSELHFFLVNVIFLLSLVLLAFPVLTCILCLQTIAAHALVSSDFRIS